MRLLLPTSVLLLLISPLSAFAVTIHVPGDQPTIQAGIDAASLGDTVLVAAGTYTGDGSLDLDFGGKDLVVKSESGPELSIIDGEETYRRGFYFHQE